MPAESCVSCTKKTAKKISYWTVGSAICRANSRLSYRFCTHLLHTLGRCDPSELRRGRPCGQQQAQHGSGERAQRRAHRRCLEPPGRPGQGAGQRQPSVPGGGHLPVAAARQSRQTSPGTGATPPSFHPRRAGIFILISSPDRRHPIPVRQPD